MAGDIYTKGGKRGVRTSCQIETARRGVNNIMGDDRQRAREGGGNVAAYIG
jgi:hypothetical protein